MINPKIVLPLLFTFFIGCSDNSSTSTPTNASQSVRDLTVVEASQLIENNNAVVVLDIRTPEEFAQGHIEGAVNIDYRQSDFANQLAQLDKNQPYLLHCHSGGRSTKALKVINELGFTNVAHMRAGIQGWRAADQPQVTQ